MIRNQTFLLGLMYRGSILFTILFLSGMISKEWSTTLQFSLINSLLQCLQPHYLMWMMVDYC